MVTAHAWLISDYKRTCTDQVRFEVSQLDEPSAQSSLRIAGRVTANDAGWSLDFSVDGTVPIYGCL